LIEAIYEIQPIFVTNFDLPESVFGLSVIYYKYFSHLSYEFQTYITGSCLFLSNVSLILKTVKRIIDKVLFHH